MPIMSLLILGTLLVTYGIFLLALTYKFKTFNKWSKYFMTCMIVILMIGTCVITIAIMLIQIQDFFNVLIVW